MFSTELMDKHHYVSRYTKCVRMEKLTHKGVAALRINFLLTVSWTIWIDLCHKPKSIFFGEFLFTQQQLKIIVFHN